jgi:enhancer of polycomb-like protein
VRKTRASTVTSSDKLVRLNAELSLVLDIANTTLNRETTKDECMHNAENLWGKRHAFVEVKCKVTVPGDKAEDEWLYEKERLPKKPKLDIKYVCHKVFTVDY